MKSSPAIEQLVPDALAVPRSPVVNRNPLAQFYRGMAVGGAKVVFVGDSLTEGRGASYEHGFVPRLATRMRRALDLNWTPGLKGSTYIPAIPGYPRKDRYPWTLGGSMMPAVDIHEPYGLGRRSVLLTDDQYAELTFTGDAMEIFLTAGPDYGLAGIQLNDGEGGTTFRTWGSRTTTAVTTGSTSWKSSCKPIGRSTWTVRVKAYPGQTIRLEGGVFHDGDATTGVTLYDGGHSGYRVLHFSGEEPRTRHWALPLAKINPDLVVVALGTNDILTGGPTPAETYGDRVRSIVELIKVHAPRASVALLAQPCPNGHSVNVWEDYIEQQREAARCLGAAVLDVRDRVPSGVHGGDELYKDNVHPLAPGYEAYAQALAWLLKYS